MKSIADVTHFEDEGLVGLVVDYRVAAVIMWLFGSVSSSDVPTNSMFTSLEDIPHVMEYYEHIMSVYDNDWKKHDPCFNEFYSTGVMKDE